MALKRTWLVKARGGRFDPIIILGELERQTSQQSA